MKEGDEAKRSQGRARGLYDEQAQRIQQEKKLLKAEAAARKMKEVA